MSCNYAEGLSEYENKGRLGAPEKFDTVEEVKVKVDQLVQLVQEAKHIGRAAVQTQAQIKKGGFSFEPFYSVFPIRIQSGQLVRIRIRFRNPDPGDQNDPQK
jgi:hypothetical protein